MGYLKFSSDLISEKKTSPVPKNKKMLSKLTLATPLFDHGVFPTPPTLNLQTITSLYNPLLLSSDSDNKITLEKFKDTISSHCSFMAPADAEVYFVLFKVLTEDDLSFLAKRSNQAKLNPIKENSLFPGKTANLAATSGLYADFRELIIFMFLQTFSTSLRHNIDLKQKEFNAQWEPNVFGHFNESIRGNPPSPLLSQLSSPRSQTTRIPLNNEYPQAAKFIKNNIKQILKFIVGDLTTRNNPHVNLSPDDFDILSFLFTQDPQLGGFAGMSLSEYSGLFKNSKVSLTAAADWIGNNISPENTSKMKYLHYVTPFHR